MKNLLAKFAKDENGATAIEYALIAAGIAVVVIPTVKVLGLNVTAIFTKVAAALT